MKKSFLIYKDSLSILNKMTTEQVGQLFLAIAEYQLEGSLPDLDLALQFAIEPFINQFIRDDEKYQSTSNIRRESGQKGGYQKQANLANATKSKQSVANLADSVSDIDSDSEKDNDINSAQSRSIEKSLLGKQAKCIDRAKAFKNEIRPYVQSFNPEMCEAFYKYWSETNKTQTLMRWEQEKTWDLKLRLERWARNGISNKNPPISTPIPSQLPLGHEVLAERERAKQQHLNNPTDATT